jgi:hypothetical protein
MARLATRMMLTPLTFLITHPAPVLALTLLALALFIGWRGLQDRT